MREISHETGRRQVLGIVRLITNQSCKRVVVTEVGNAYTSASLTCFVTPRPSSSQICYDAVIKFKFSTGAPEIACLIESKAAHKSSSRSKLPAQLREFVLNAYWVLSGWKDKHSRHKPLFLFVAPTPFDADLLTDGLLNKDATTKYLKREIRRVNASRAESLRDHVRVFFYGDWLQDLVG